ncbi:MAG: HNH endonuclease [Rhodobacteraceae bacterium]|nr:HNH endonuclease [Paracoccaceae bacterium]
MEPNFKSGTVWTGDNLPIMRGMNSDCIDLIYLDPPFNSNANYAAPVGSTAAGAAFKDTWSLNDIDVAWLDLIEGKHPNLWRAIQAAMCGSDKSYLVYMAARLIEMERILKDTGSIYLHCDPTMSHYLKLLMDAVFGRKNFQNEFIWYYGGGGASKSRWARKHDVILFYSVGNKWTFNADDVRVPHKWNEGQKRADGSKRSEKGKIADDVFQHHSVIPWSKERTGYPTQKPLALLDRIIKASSNEGDMVFDPFCGCATTLVAANRLNRKWAGIDLSEKAVELVDRRIRNDIPLFGGAICRTDIPQRTDLGSIPKYNHPDNKKSLYGAQAGYCAGCGTHFERQHLEIDHIIATKQGGTDHIDNLQLLCGNCNRIKGDRGMEYLTSKLGV